MESFQEDCDVVFNQWESSDETELNGEYTQTSNR